MCQIIRLEKEELFQTSIALQKKKSKCQLLYSDFLLKAFYVCIIIKVPALLVSSVNNRYTGLVRAGKFFNRGWVLFK